MPLEFGIDALDGQIDIEKDSFGLSKKEEHMSIHNDKKIFGIEIKNDLGELDIRNS